MNIIEREKRPCLVKRITEIKIVVIFKPHAADDNDINFGLQGDARQQLIVRFAGDGEDRYLLRFDEGIEHVNHRNPGTDHLSRNDSFCRID
jgi:hypothetical protein